MTELGISIKEFQKNERIPYKYEDLKRLLGEIK